MSKKSKKVTDIESGGLLLFIFQRRVPLLTITLAAMIVSVVVSLLIPPKFSSTVVLYATPTASISRSLFSIDPSRLDLMSFGLEADAERLLQILESDKIRERMVDKYNLMEHYGIDHESRFPYTRLEKRFYKNVRFSKNRYMAIELEVRDTDPEMAANLANDIASLIDSTMNSMMNERAHQSLAIVEEEYHRLAAEVELMEDSLKRIRRMGVIDYESQAEVLNDAFARAVLERDTESIELFSDKLHTLSEYGGIYINLRENLLWQIEKINRVRGVVGETRINAERMIPYKFIVSEARVAEKKSYPVRSVIVAVSTIAAFLLTLFSLLLIDAIRNLKT